MYSKEDPVGIPPLVINDHPSISHRAVLLDVSQERIPTIVCIETYFKVLSNVMFSIYRSAFLK
jgi:hypothetical protein